MPVDSWPLQSPTTCCTFVTGPSRTADIELTLTVGVHGPRQVIIIVGPLETLEGGPEGPPLRSQASQA